MRKKLDALSVFQLVLMGMILIGIIFGIYLISQKTVAPRPRAAPSGIKPLILFDTDKKLVNPGDTVDLIIKINPRGGTFYGFDLKFFYDPEKIEIQENILEQLLQSYDADKKLLKIFTVDKEKNLMSLAGAKIGDQVITGTDDLEMAKVTIKIKKTVQQGDSLSFKWNQQDTQFVGEANSAEAAEPQDAVLPIGRSFETLSPQTVAPPQQSLPIDQPPASSDQQPPNQPPPASQTAPPETAAPAQQPLSSDVQPPPVQQPVVPNQPPLAVNQPPPPLQTAPLQTAPEPLPTATPAPVKKTPLANIIWPTPIPTTVGYPSPTPLAPTTSPFTSSYPPSPTSTLLAMIPSPTPLTSTTIITPSPSSNAGIAPSNLSPAPTLPFSPSVLPSPPSPATAPTFVQEIIALLSHLVKRETNIENQSASTPTISLPSTSPQIPPFDITLIPKHSPQFTTQTVFSLMEQKNLPNFLNKLINLFRRNKEPAETITYQLSLNPDGLLNNSFGIVIRLVTVNQAKSPRNSILINPQKDKPYYFDRDGFFETLTQAVSQYRNYPTGHNRVHQLRVIQIKGAETSADSKLTLNEWELLGLSQFQDAAGTPIVQRLRQSQKKIKTYNPYFDGARGRFTQSELNAIIAWLNNQPDQTKIPVVLNDLSRLLISDDAIILRIDNR